MADQKVNVQPAALTASSKYAEACKVLAEAAEEGDDRARKALKQLAKASDEGDDKSDDGGKKDDDKGSDAARAASDGEDKKDDKKEEAKAASAVVSGPSALESATRARLIAARPDLANDAEIQKLFASCTIADLKSAVETLPKAEFKAPVAAPAGTRGAQAASEVVNSDASDDLDARMGLKPHSRMTVTKAPGIVVFGGTRAQASREISAYESFRNGGNTK